MNVSYVGETLDTFHFSKHAHKLYELLYYTNGSGTIVFNDGSENFYPGDIFLIAPGIEHEEKSECGYINTHATMMEVSFPVSNYIKLRDNENKDIYTIFSQMYQVYHMKFNNWAPLVDSLCEVIFQYILSFSELTQFSPVVYKIILDIIKNFSDPNYTTANILSQQPFHPEYLREIFIKETGISPNKFLIKKRMEHARHLIDTIDLSGYSLKEISFMCGYNDFYYFSRSFKQNFGLSPKFWIEKTLESRD